MTALATRTAARGSLITLASDLEGDASAVPASHGEARRSASSEGRDATGCFRAWGEARQSRTNCSVSPGKLVDAEVLRELLAAEAGVRDAGPTQAFFR